MTHVATLIAGADELRSSYVADAHSILPEAGETRWLADGIAADIRFTPETGTDQCALAGQLREILSARLDVVVQPIANRRKKLFLADMDSTMIGQECIDELAEYVGLKSHVAAITERAMRGEIEFEPALRERVALLRGLDIAVIQDVLNKRITLSPGARTLVATLKAHGTHTCLVSGGFTLFTDPVAALIGFDKSRGNKLVIAEGHKLAGSVAEPIFGRDGKRTTLIELRQALSLAKEETMAVGDGANDIDMIAEAGLGVAYHAKPKLKEAARAKIEHADLTALLYIQGYQRAEFAIAD
jgi:phosphoserine phosphatase